MSDNRINEIRGRVRSGAIGATISTDWPMDTVMDNIKQASPDTILIALLTLECEVEKAEKRLREYIDYATKRVQSFGEENFKLKCGEQNER